MPQIVSWKDLNSMSEWVVLSAGHVEKNLLAIAIAKM